MSKTDAEKALSTLINMQQSPLTIDAMQKAIIRLGAAEVRLLVGMVVSDFDFARALGVGIFSLIQKLETIEPLKMQWFESSRKRSLLIEALVMPLTLTTIETHPSLAKEYADALLVCLQQERLPEPLIAALFEALANLEGDDVHPDVGSAFVLQRGSLTEKYFGLYIDLMEKYQQKPQVLRSLAGKPEIVLQLLDNVSLQEETAKDLVSALMDNIWQNVRTFAKPDASFVSEARNLFNRFLSRGQWEYAAMMFEHRFSGMPISSDVLHGSRFSALFYTPIFGISIPVGESNRQSLLAQVALPLSEWLAADPFPKRLVSAVLQHANQSTVNSFLNASEKLSEQQCRVLQIVFLLKGQLNAEVFTNENLSYYYTKYMDYCASMLDPAFDHATLIHHCEELHALLQEHPILASDMRAMLNDESEQIYATIKKILVPALAEHNLSLS